MDKTKSAAAGKFGNTEQVLSHSKSAVPDGQINVETVQTLLLIWLDQSIDENSADCQNTIAQLRRVANSVNTFTDADQCVDFLRDIYFEKVCIIISGTLCQNVVPSIHDVAQLDTIFIFCENKTKHERWAKDWSKIKGVFTEISPICEALKQVPIQCEQNAISISFISTSDDVPKKNLDQLDSSFMYTQILKEILLTIQFEQKHIKAFIDHCREQFAENTCTLKNLQKFETEYYNETPIWWCSRESILYSMLNHSLRLMDVDIIIKMGFFIRDLHRHIEQLHKEQFGHNKFGKSFTVYRGQGMSKEDFEQMAKNKGGLISFNNFLSTSMDHDVSLLFAESNQYSPDLIGILFVINIDPSTSLVPFASTNDVNGFQKEEEVLFSMHTVFRIVDIKSMDANHRLFQVELTLTSDNDKDLRVLTDHIRTETHPEIEGWQRLGLMLLKMGQFDKAEEVYEILLEQATNESEKAPIYGQLGLVKYNLGEYKKSLTFYEKSLEILQKTLPPNDYDFSSSYNNIGNVYDSMGEFSKALSYYEKALEIKQKILPPNHPDLATAYNNIGSVYDNMSEYSKALSYYEKALEIRQRTLPQNHPDSASSYNNIGNVYYNMGEYSKALSFHEKALEIRQRTLPLNHPDLASSYNNIGGVYFDMGEYSKACLSHGKALEIKQKILPPNHSSLGASYNNIGNVYHNMGEYSKALSSHEKALDIRQRTLPPNHPELASSYNNIGVVYKNLGEYSKALLFYEEALEIRETSLPPNHPHLTSSYNNIGTTHDTWQNGGICKSSSILRKST